MQARRPLVSARVVVHAAGLHHPRVVLVGDECLALEHEGVAAELPSGRHTARSRSSCRAVREYSSRRNSWRSAAAWAAIAAVTVVTTGTQTARSFSSQVPAAAA